MGYYLERIGPAFAARRWVQQPHDRLITPFVSAHFLEHHFNFIALSISHLLQKILYLFDPYN